MPFIHLSEAAEPLYEAEDRRESYLKLQCHQDRVLHLEDLLLRDDLVYDSEDGLHVWRVDLFILTSDLKSCDAQTLQVIFAHVVHLGQVVVHDAYRYI